MQATQVTKQSFLDKTFKLKENAELEVKGWGVLLLKENILVKKKDIF